MQSSEAVPHALVPDLYEVQVMVGYNPFETFEEDQHQVDQQPHYNTHVQVRHHVVTHAQQALQRLFHPLTPTNRAPPHPKVPPPMYIPMYIPMSNTGIDPSTGARRETYLSEIKIKIKHASGTRTADDELPSTVITDHTATRKEMLH
jgi:hypothetical protein